MAIKKLVRKVISLPFFLEGESLCWLLEGVEVATLDGSTSRGSVGVTGLTEVTVLTDP